MKKIACLFFLFILASCATKNSKNEDVAIINNTDKDSVCVFNPNDHQSFFEISTLMGDSFRIKRTDICETPKCINYVTLINNVPVENLYKIDDKYFEQIKEPDRDVYFENHYYYSRINISQKKTIYTTLFQSGYSVTGDNYMALATVYDSIGKKISSFILSESIMDYGLMTQNGSHNVYTDRYGCFQNDSTYSCREDVYEINKNETIYEGFSYTIKINIKQNGDLKIDTLKKNTYKREYFEY